MREYDQIAAWYAATRDPRVGVDALAALARRLPPGARVLDLGCGDGVPLSQWLVGAGFQVQGIDSSREMVARYRANVPGATVRRERIEDARVAAGSQAAIVAWGVWFHLSEAEQRAAFGRVAGWLAPGGWFLFTSGDVAGVREGEMDGVAFRYVSLDASGYQEALETAGLRLERTQRDAWDNAVYLAQKPA